MAEQIIPVRVCNVCKAEKPLTEFAKRKQRPSGYGSTCKHCVKEFSRKYRKENSEALKLKDKARYLVRGAAQREALREAWATDPEFRKAKASSLLKWRKENVEYLQEYESERYYSGRNKTDSERHRKARENPEYRNRMLEKTRKYYAANKPDFIARNSIRRSSEARATPKWADRKAISNIYKKSAELSLRFSVDFCVDHIVPIQSKIVCGLHVECNLQILSREINSSKSNSVWPDMPD
jgi:transposase-like protein